MLTNLTRITAITGLIAAFVILVSAATPPVAAQGEATPTPEREGPIPCDPTGSRQIINPIVQAGGEIEVRAEFDFNCTGEDRVINFILVVEDTQAMRSSQEELKNVRDGLARFVNGVNFTNGSRGGMTLFADDYSNRVIPRTGNDHKEFLLNHISRINASSSGGSSGAGAAIRNATERLPTGQTEATNVLVYVDAGAAVTEPPLVSLRDACEAAANAGVVVIYVGLADAGYRNAGCATQGWVRAVGDEDATDFPEIMQQFATDLVKGLRAQGYEYVDMLKRDFSYVDGSGSPDDPDKLPLGDLSWSWDTSLPAGGRQVIYKIKVPTVDEDPNGIYINRANLMSLKASLWLYFGAGLSREMVMENPYICVYEDNPSTCQAALPTATSTPGGETPTPTESPTDPPTQVTPTETPTEEPTGDTPTPETPDPTPSATATLGDDEPVSVFLPIAYNREPVR